MFGRDKINDPWNTMGDTPTRKKGKKTEPSGSRKHWDDMPLDEAMAMTKAYESIKAQHDRQIGRTWRAFGTGPSMERGLAQAALSNKLDEDLARLQERYNYSGPWRC
jgi:hypothetical protein